MRRVMRVRASRRITATLVLGALALAAAASRLGAHADGVTGKYQSDTGCSCHGTTPNEAGSVVVDILGPTGLLPNATGHYTLTVNGGPAGTTGGLDVHASGGNFTAGPGTQITGGEVVQIDNTHRSWTFDWKAPATQATYNLHAIAMASDDDGGTGGDSWNWFGGVAGTPLAIVVNSAVDADPLAMGLRLEPPYPNPSQGPSRISYRLPHDAHVTLEVIDARGRREAVLIEGVVQAGQHTVLWDARAALGSSAASGAYWVRLSVEGLALQQRFILIR